jgi:ABC-2 type transport system ATP-binding protein
MELIELQGITKKFGNYTAVDNIDVKISKGVIFGLLGPNGAGKTTTIRMITNIIIPDSGSILINGSPVTSEMQNIMGYLPEERGLYKKLKVIDQLVYFARLKGISKIDAEKKAKFWLSKFGAAGWENKKIQELSKGMQQKIQFISTILHDPEIMILDEPFSGFDPINTELLKSIILEMKEQGKTIILSTHVMAQVEQMCDDMLLINMGKVVLSGPVRQVKAQYGKDTILMEFDGDNSFLDEFEGIKINDKSSSRLEFKILNSGVTPNMILEKAMQNAQIYKFERLEPSLNEIFIDVVGEQNIKNSGENTNEL